MSKSRNIKRARLLRQNKRNREIQSHIIAPLARYQKDLIESVSEDGTIVIDRASLGKQDKISALIIEMVKPLIFAAESMEEIEDIISLAICAWNCGIIKEKSGDEKLNSIIKSFKVRMTKEQKRLLDEHINLKCTRYKEYHELITDFKVTFDQYNGMGLTVFTDVTDVIS